MIIVAYDIPKNHNSFKAYLIGLKYQDSLQGSKGITYLPNTTLVKEGVTPAQGLEDLQAAAKHVGVSLERAIAGEFSNWTGVFGTPHK
jgi:hypothetical protein